MTASLARFMPLLLTVVALMVLHLVKAPISAFILGFDPGRVSAPDYLPAFSVMRLVTLPAAALAALTLCVAPGLALHRAFRPADDLRLAALCGFGLTVVTVTLSVMLVCAVVGAEAYRPVYAGAVIGIAALGGLLTGRPLRARREGPGGNPGGDDAGRAPGGGRADLLIAAALAAGLVIVFAGKYALESFNDDGMQALLAAAHLVASNVPFWPAGHGALNDYPDFGTMGPVFPTGWFVAQFGAHEFSARIFYPALAALLYLVLAAHLCQARGCAPSAAERLLILGIVVIYSIAGSYSATYETYADIALPLTRETMFGVAALAAILMAEARRSAATVIFTVLAAMSLPTGSMILASVAVFTLLFTRRPAGFRGALVLLVASVVTLVVMAVAPMILDLLGAAPPGNEFGAGGMRSRLRYVSLTDIEEIAFVLVPYGIVPALIGIFLFRRGDRSARAMVLTAMAYFLLFYFQAYRSLLHHFIPAGLLLLAAGLRNPASDPARSRVLAAVTAGAMALSFCLVLPRTWTLEERPHVAARAIALTPDLAAQADLSLAADIAETIEYYFPPTAYVLRHRAGLPTYAEYVLGYYARRTPADGPDVGLLLCNLPDCPAGAGRFEVARVGIQFLDKARLQAARVLTTEPLRTAPLLRVRPEKAFSFVDEGQSTDGRVIDLKPLLQRLRG